MKLVKNTSTVSFFILISRILGFIRDMVMANLVGVSALADAFFVAFKFPNLFRRLFAEGALSAAFIPVFQQVLHDQGEEKAWLFVSRVFSVLIFFLLPFVLLIQVFMPWVIPLLAPGFLEDNAQYHAVVAYARICFPYLLFMALLALITSVLNSYGRFAAGASAPILLNVCLLITLFVFVPYFPDIGYALSWTVAFAGIVQFLWAFIALKRYKKTRLQVIRPECKSKDKDISKFMKLLGPSVLGAGITQINILVGTIFATLIPGGVSYLYYADRLNQLPLALIGIAMGMVLLPSLGKLHKEKRFLEAVKLQNEALFFSMMLALPATFAFFVLGSSIVEALFQGGAFLAHDTRATVLTLKAYALGLPAYILIKVLTPAFFATSDTKTPMIMAFFSMIINVTLIPNFMAILDYVGIALATAVSAWFQVCFLALAAYKRGFFTWESQDVMRYVRLTISTFIMTGFVFWLQLLFWEAASGKALQVVILAGLVLAGVIMYFICLFVMGVSKESILRFVMARKRKL